MHRTKVFLLIGCASLVVGGTACAAIWGFHDPEDALAGAVDGSVADGRAPGCALEKVDPTQGTFVVPNASTDPNCGELANPCASIQTAITRASALGRPNVYIARGTYAESITLAPKIKVWGGWDAIKTGDEIDFVRACADPPGTAVVIAGTSATNVTVLADNVQGVSFEDIGIGTPAKGAPGQSLYGLVANGTGTDVTLTDVAITTGNGGDGTAGVTGDAGITGGSNCPTPGGGSDAGAAGGDGEEAGSLSQVGRYSAGGGAPGQQGGAGANGGLGSDGGCVDCISSCTFAVICNSSTTTSCGANGDIGCGGGGGAGGGGGQGGGATIGLFVWDATVSTTRGQIVAGNGGAGGAGGSGGGGGPGGVGTRGADQPSCPTTCTLLSGSLCGTGTAMVPEGGTGSVGAKGLTGGQGGGGAGGASIAVYKGGSSSTDPSKVTLDTGTHIDHGSGGPAGEPGGGEGVAKGVAP